MFQLALAGTAIGVARFVKIDPLDDIPADDLLVITATLAGVYVALGLIGICTRRQPARDLFVLRLATAVAVVIVGLAAWQIPVVDLVHGVAGMSVVAVLYAVVSYRMTRRTAVAVRE